MTAAIGCLLSVNTRARFFHLQRAARLAGGGDDISRSK